MRNRDLLVWFVLSLLAAGLIYRLVKHCFGGAALPDELLYTIGLIGLLVAYPVTRLVMPRQ